MDDASDPNIIARLSKQPPYDDETPIEEPVQTEEGPETPVEESGDTPTGPTEPQPAPETDSLPEDEVKKRTAEEFAKLKEHNAALKKELEAAKTQPIPQKNALDALYPEPKEPLVTNQVPTTAQYPNLAPKDIKEAFAGLTDDQGYVDTGLLKETMMELDRRAKEAEARARQAEERASKTERRQDDFERNSQMREVHLKYPKLNPENATLPDDDPNKFDDRFYAQFQKEIMYKWSTVGQADPMQVAAEASDIIYGPAMKKAEKEKAEQAELAKKNINAAAPRSTNQRDQYKDQDELIAATRKGVPGALAERLARAGQ